MARFHGNEVKIEHIYADAIHAMGANAVTLQTTFTWNSFKEKCKPNSKKVKIK